MNPFIWQYTGMACSIYTLTFVQQIQYQYGISSVYMLCFSIVYLTYVLLLGRCWECLFPCERTCLSAVVRSLTELWF